MRVMALPLVVMVIAQASLSALAQAPAGDDWPQLQHDSARTGRAVEGVAPPYQARWIWCGPDATLRNKAVNPAWGDDLNKGKDFPLVMKVPFTFSGAVQPVSAGGKVFIGDMEGKVYAISLDDGKTLWTGENPGGTVASAAVTGGTVVVTSTPGAVVGLDVQTGQRKWRIETPKAITGSPLAVGGKVFSGCHDGKVYAIDAESGKLLWTADLKAPIVADLCADDKAVYVGAEDMWFHKLDTATGKPLAKARLMGQSFRMEHPVLYKDMLFVQTVQGFCVGSEYAMEELMKDPADTDIAAEQKLILRWLAGDTNGGKWADGAQNPGANWPN